MNSEPKRPTTERASLRDIDEELARQLRSKGLENQHICGDADSLSAPADWVPAYWDLVNKIEAETSANDLTDEDGKTWHDREPML